jgi:RecB family endonuclease NucS
MNNVHDSISLIEQYLDINNAEYQVHNNNIEIYPLDKSVILIKLNKSEIEIISQAKEYSFDKINNNFFSQLQSLIS